MTTTSVSEPQVAEGINGRAFLVVDRLTLKERNAARKQYEAEGWTIKTYGSNRNGWTVQGWKGEAPTMIRQSFALSSYGKNSITPLYRKADGDGFENIDGSSDR